MTSETITLELCSKHHGSIVTPLSPDAEKVWKLPSAKDLVYNNEEYTFIISGLDTAPAKLRINDDTFDIKPEYSPENGAFIFTAGLHDSKKPFFNCFGAVKLSIEYDGISYSSRSFAVMVYNNAVNNTVMNMVQYVYDYCDKYLYKEYRNFDEGREPVNGDSVSLNSRIAFYEKTLRVFREAYHYLRVNPYSKLQKNSEIGPFDRLQTVSHATIVHIATHADELVSVNYDTGIRANKLFYQPTRTLIEHSARSYDVYENQVVIGFLYTIVEDITRLIRELIGMSCAYSPRTVERNWYIDSMYQIFSRSINDLNEYSKRLLKLKDEFKQLYFYYTKLFGINGSLLRSAPKFTPVFRSVSAYRQIYQSIYDWFTCGGYDLGRDELLLSFISTSKIYEYYCLVKMLRYMDEVEKLELISAERAVYRGNRFYVNTSRNNKFTFRSGEKTLTLYFQPVINSNDRAENGLGLFRNTTSNCHGASEPGGETYTPDFILKTTYGDHSEYLIMDAKYSRTESIRANSLQELVYKYLFSVSTLSENDRVNGLYLICGKAGSREQPDVPDSEDVVHDIARGMGRRVRPFAELVTMSGIDTSDYAIPELLLKSD